VDHRPRETPATVGVGWLLCLCAPSGQEEFFMLVGQPVATRTQASLLDADAQAAFIAKSKALAPEYKTELLPRPARSR